MVCPGFAGNSERVLDQDNEVRGSERRHGRVRPRNSTRGMHRKKEMMRTEGTYTDLLANLLVYDDVDERPGYCHAVLAGHQVLKGHLRQRLLC